MSHPPASPDPDRLSALTALILLALVSALYIRIPDQDIVLSLPGVYLELQITTSTVVAIMVGGLAATGAAWLLADHPARSGRALFPLQHLILPALTAWVVEITLSNTALGPLWWATLGIGAGLFILVLAAEYLAVDEADNRQPASANVLIALSFALFLVLAIRLRSNAVRLLVLLPALVPSAGLITLRALHLRSGGHWRVPQALTAALVIAQIAAGLHYLPLSSLTFGVMVMGAAYALTSLFANLSDGRPLLQALLEPSLALAVLVGLAVWLQ